MVSFAVNSAVVDDCFHAACNNSIKKLQLNFYLQGITEKEPLAIQTSSQGEIKEEGKSIEIEAVKDKRNNFEVSFAKQVSGSIEFEAYEV